MSCGLTATTVLVDDIDLFLSLPKSIITLFVGVILNRILLVFFSVVSVAAFLTNAIVLFVIIDFATFLDVFSLFVSIDLIICLDVGIFVTFEVFDLVELLFVEITLDV
jgi:hypothetical protein